MAAETCAVATSKRASARGTRRPATAKKKRRRRRLGAGRVTTLLRYGVVAVFLLVGLLYYQPLANYVDTKRTLDERRAEVHRLREERQRLEARLVRSATVEALSREARRMGLVREGERLVIVKGIAEWRRSIHSDG